MRLPKYTSTMLRQYSVSSGAMTRNMLTGSIVGVISAAAMDAPITGDAPLANQGR